MSTASDAPARRIRAWAEGGFEVTGVVSLYGEPVTRTVTTATRVIWGSVYSNGSKWCGDGFTCSATGTEGIFQINFNPDFTSRPCVLAVQHYPVDSDDAMAPTGIHTVVLIERVVPDGQPISRQQAGQVFFR